MRISHRYIFIALDVLLAVYLVFAITSFNKHDDGELTCKEVKISITDNHDMGFLSAQDIKTSLQRAHLYPEGQLISNVDPRAIEDAMKKNPFVSDAQCYKTQNATVHISVKQRTPVVRVKSENGEDYYIDNRDSIMPTSGYTSNLPIATGNITKWYARNYVAPMCRHISENELWSNQVEQVNVLPDKTIELVPRVGDHIVNIGRLPEHNDNTRREQGIFQFLDNKLARLEKFYRYGLSQAGWNKYSYINLEFDNQIICKRHKKETASVIVNEPTDEKPKTSDTDKKTTSEKKPTSEKKTTSEKERTDKKSTSDKKPTEKKSSEKKQEKKPEKKQEKKQEQKPEKKQADKKPATDKKKN